MKEIKDYNKSIFESIKHIDDNGNEYWSARELQKVLEYTEYRKFLPTIEKAKQACINSKNNVLDHFSHVSDMIEIGKGAQRKVDNYKLSRYACYLIAQNGDSRKEVIALAQTYFAIQTRKQELFDEDFKLLSEDEKRLRIRKEVRKGNYGLNQVAKESGVKNFDKFHNAGYKGLYNGETADDIAKRKGLRYREDILDNMGSIELADNLFRIVQTEDKLKRDNVDNEYTANSVHFEMGRKVRKAIKDMGGTMPEDLPTPKRSIKELKKEETKEMEEIKNEIIIFENQNIKLEVNMKDETVWLSLDQISKLFDRDKSVISRHIKNALNEELDNSVIAKFATTAKDGKIYQVDYYNLDMIISIGYRVKSKNGIIFRKWANGVLKDYLIKGYSVNQKRLEYLEKTVKLIDIAGRIEKDLNNDEAKGIFNVINDYSKGLDLLDDYDHKKLIKPKGTNSSEIITYEECLNIINLLRFNSDSNLFALERNQGLKSIINNIYQSFDNKDVYPTIEEKAANFLYLITKNHTFIDGNKRIAATLFIYFLFYYDILYKEDVQVIDNNTLVAITLLIAQSNPKEKDIIIDLIMNFLI